MKTANPGDFQIIHSSGVEYYKRYADGGFLTEINEANIPNLKLVMPAMIEPFRKITPKLSCAPWIAAPPASPITPRSSPKPRPRRRVPSCSSIPNTRTRSAAMAT